MQPVSNVESWSDYLKKVNQIKEKGEDFDKKMYNEFD